ncbi:MAG: hypothetical protein DMD73_10175 [Gemmatimonadetes bacterium]|nr:MAG: hypothetical protein DMD73_10175 [Gemmatimonadota bacterium]
MGVGGATGLAAQGVVVSGRVLYGPAGRPLARTRVVLHQVSMGGDGRPIDSTSTDAQGRYTLTIRRPDSTAMYVVSSWHAGIAYFSEPVVPSRSTSVPLRALYVYDTSSAGPAVRVARRLMTVAKLKRDGSRDVLELLELENPGPATRVAADTLRPTWAGAIPAAAIQFQVGQGDLSARAVTLRGDSVAVFGPIPPGERKQLSYAYVLPATARRVDLPIDQPTAEVDLLLEDTAAVVRAARLDSLGVERIEGRRFARYRTPALGAGAQLAIAFSDRPLAPEALVPFVVGLAALALAVGFVVALRRKPR